MSFNLFIRHFQPWFKSEIQGFLTTLENSFQHWYNNRPLGQT